MLVTVKTESGHTYSFKSENGKVVLDDKNGEVIEGSIKIVMGEPMKFKYHPNRGGEIVVDRTSVFQTTPVEEIEIS